MSANSTVAGTRFFGWNIAVSWSSRASGTRDIAHVRLGLSVGTGSFVDPGEELEERRLSGAGETYQAGSNMRNSAW